MNEKIMNQLKLAKNKDNFMMSMINPEQQNAFKQFQQMGQMEQAQKIADYCNKNGISKEQLQRMIQGIN